MEQVRRHAGVSNGSLYHLFPNKAALAAQVGSGQRCIPEIRAAEIAFSEDDAGQVCACKGSGAQHAIFKVCGPDPAGPAYSIFQVTV